MLYAVSHQNWEPLGSYFWVSHLIHLLLACLKHDLKPEKKAQDEKMEVDGASQVNKEVGMYKNEKRNSRVWP